MSVDQPNKQRGKLITVLVLLGIILLAMVIGAVSIIVAAPYITFPEDAGMLRGLHLSAALLTQAGAL